MDKKTKSIMVFTVMAIFAIFGISAIAFAGCGMRYGHMGSSNWGPGSSPRE